MIRTHSNGRLTPPINWPRSRIARFTSAEPDRVDSTELQAERLSHRVCSPPCRPNARVRSRGAGRLIANFPARQRQKIRSRGWVLPPTAGGCRRRSFARKASAKLSPPDAQHDLAILFRLSHRGKRRRWRLSALSCGTTRSNCWPVRRLQSGGRVQRQDRSAVDDADPVAGLDLLDIMRGDDDGQIALLPRRADVMPDALARLRVEPDRRFIQEQDARIVHQSPGDLHPPFHAGGQRPHQPVAPVRQFHERQQVRDPPAAERTRNAVHQAVEIQVLIHRQPIVETGFLKHHADLAPASGGVRQRVGAADRYRSGVGSQDGAHDVQQHLVFPAPLGPRRANTSPRTDVERDVFQRLRAAVALADSADADLRFAHGAGVPGKCCFVRMAAIVPSAVREAMAGPPHCAGTSACSTGWRRHRRWRRAAAPARSHAASRMPARSGAMPTAPAPRPAPRRWCRR